MTARAVYAIAWGKNHDPPQGGGWILPDGSFVPSTQPPTTISTKVAGKCCQCSTGCSEEAGGSGPHPELCHRCNGHGCYPYYCCASNYCDDPACISNQPDHPDYFPHPEIL